MLFRSTLLLALVSLTACSSTRAPAGGGSVEFDEITVRRVNVVGPDGSPRVVLAAEDLMPGPTIGGVERARDISPAGLLFYGLDGDEVGGLVATGDSTRHQVQLILDYSNADGARLLTYDRGEAGYLSGVVVPDRRPLDAEGVWGASPARVGAVVNNGTSYVTLNDANGKERLVLTVAAEGDAKILFLDEAGNVVRTITADGATEAEE